MRCCDLFRPRLRTASCSCCLIVHCVECSMTRRIDNPNAHGLTSHPRDPRMVKADPMSIPLPTIEQYEETIIELEGRYTIAGRYLANESDAAKWRRLTAEAYHRADVASRKWVQQEMQREKEQSTYSVAS